MVKCPPITVDDSRLIMVEYNDTYGKRAAFKCAWGFQMSGVNSIECLADSTWSHRIPTCTGNAFFYEYIVLQCSIELFLRVRD